MPNRPRLISKPFNYKSISTQRWIISLVFGLLASLLLNAFFDVVRETYRVISLNFLYFYEPLSKVDWFINNLFFAYISFISGNSLVVVLIFSRQQKVLEYRDRNRKRLLNEQVFLNLNFLFWYLKFGLALGFFSMYSLDLLYKVEGYWLKALLVLVLYLETTKTLSKVIGRKRFKLMFINFAIISLLSVFLSCCNLVDYKAHNKLVAPTEVNLPISNYEDEYERKFRYPIILRVNNVDNKIELESEDKKKFGVQYLGAFIQNEKNSRREEELPFLTVSLIIDKDFSLHKLKDLEQEFYNLNISSMSYVIHNNDPSKINYELKYLPKHLNKSIQFFDKKTEEDLLDLELNSFKSIVRIKIQSNNFIIDGISMNSIELTKYFEKHIDESTLFNYQYDLDARYQDFISLYSSHLKARNNLVLKHSVIAKPEYEEYYDSAYNKEERFLKNKFPILVFENKLR